jgi:AmiR/NasT family two-component response regulator
MTKPTISEFNCELGEITTRELTKEELAQIKLDVANAAAELAEVQAKAEAKAALLDRLGITEEEAKLLLA